MAQEVIRVGKFAYTKRH